MTIDRILFSTLFVLFAHSGFSQTYWKIENEHRDEILLTLEVNKEQNTFEAFSRKDALKDLAGVFTYALAKAAGKLKYPEIVFIEGKTSTRKDSLFLSGTFNYFDKQFLFSAIVADSHFFGKYLDNKGRPHLLNGVKMSDLKPIRDYSTLINIAFSLTEKSLVNQVWLKSDEWLDFKRKVNGLKLKIADDYELAATCFWLGKKLPFSPYEIKKGGANNMSSGRKNHVSIHEINSSVALFEGNSLPGTQREMDSIAVIVYKTGYRNLIIDLRGNSRLSLASGNILINYLSDKQFNAGVYLTRRWSDHNSVIPKSPDYQKLFKSFKDSDSRVGELYKESGCYVAIIPGQHTFKGKVFLLTDSKTSRVAEMVTYVLNSRKIAIIAGQKTAGLTVLAESIKLDSEYDLLIPDCDFYTNEGRSLNNIGVEPDIPKSGDEVMKHVLSVL